MPRWKTHEANFKRVRLSTLGIYTSTLPLLLVPALPSTGTADARYQAYLGTTALLVAFERHRRKTGSWPETIEAIDPSILPQAPIDSFSGKPFRMDRREGRIVIYSIGPNGVDEHGAVEIKKLNRGGPDDFGGSVWDVPLRGKPAGTSNH